MTRTAFGCSGFGWLPALRASTVPADRCSTRASAICERALLPVHRNSSRALARLGATSAGWRRREREPGMQRAPGVAEEVPAAKQIGPVVDVATVSRAAAGADDAGVSELRQVVRDQVRRLPDQLHELADTAIAATELANQLPAQRIAEQAEDLWRLQRWHVPIRSN